MIEFMLLLAAFAVVGALLGLVWAHFAPGRPLGYVVSKDAIIPDETESFIATDGRFAIFTAVVGAIFGAAAWTRRGTRGPIMVLTLALGGLIGALLTSVVGTAVGGGSASGTPNTVITMQLAVHAKPMLAFEAFTAVFVYTLAVLFTDRTDLGRGDPADQWRTDASGDQVSVTSPAQPVPQPTAEAAPESLTHPVPQPPVTPESFRPE
ncbi:Protein of unknown function [Frankineae bacterium MT45]|nr:Protein of unknown function [Frankineae bacterium MT45]